MKYKTLTCEDISDIRVSIAKGRTITSLAIQYGCHKTTIHRRLRTYQEDRRLGRKKIFRRRKCSQEQLYMIVRFFHDDPFSTALECKARLQLPVSVRTIDRYTKMLKLVTGVAPRKFYIAPDHCENRLRYAIGHHLWTIEEWQSIVFTDESGLCNGGFYRRHVRRAGRGQRDDAKYANRFVNKTLRLNFFSFVSIHGVGELSFHKRVNWKVYCNEIVEPMIEELREKFGDQNFKVVHDNASFAQSDDTRLFLRRRGLDKLFMKIPAYSPDTNIIENLWAFMKRRVKNKIYEHGHFSRLLFEDLIQSEWADIPYEIIRKLYDSLPRRMRAIVDAEGQLSRY